MSVAGTGLAAVVLAGLIPIAAGAQTLSVAAASDLQAALPDIATRFEQETGHHLALTFGSSGNFFMQIANGAPFDVFLSADVDYPRRLEQSGAAERGTLREYATGRLVLWVRNDAGVDVRQGLAALGADRVRHVAIANPEHAPYGRAAVAALRHEQLYDTLRSKLVFGENISQTAQFAQSGSADAGLIALSLALSPALRESGSYFEIPESWHPPIVQAAIVLSSSRAKAAARQFVDYLSAAETIRTLRAYGFAIAPSTVR
jgi:molybdate transport system substrate-binding protein